MKSNLLLGPQADNAGVFHVSAQSKQSPASFCDMAKGGDSDFLSQYHKAQMEPTQQSFPRDLLFQPIMPSVKEELDHWLISSSKHPTC